MSNKKQITTTTQQPVKFSFEGGELRVPSGKDGDFWVQKLYETFGSSDPETIELFTNQLVRVLAPDGENRTNALNGITPILCAINPSDELECMLAVQMIGIHNMAMEMMRRAMVSGQSVEGVSNNVNRVSKLTRTFIAQMEALNRHRGKGKQKITVEHVTVNEGGQAIVGSVEQGGRDENRN